jgi:hypothetical protein
MVYVRWRGTSGTHIHLLQLFVQLADLLLQLPRQLNLRRAGLAPLHQRAGCAGQCRAGQREDVQMGQRDSHCSN